MHAHRHRPPPATDTGRTDRRLVWAVGVNLLLTVAQVAGGMMAGSLALIADAIHNLSDALSLAIALLARRIARRPAHAGMTFGYRRAEIIAALINLTTLIVIGLYLVSEGVARLFAPIPVDGWLVVAIAGVALVIDLATVALTFRPARGSMNIRAAFLHNLADALGSVAVIVAGAAILLYGWTIVDPLVTLAIAGYVLWHAFREIGPAIRILMEAVPPGLGIAEISEALTEIAEVVEVHHLHVWSFDEHEYALEAHIVIDEADVGRIKAVKAAAKRLLAERFSIRHTSLEIEFADESCPEHEKRLVAPH